MAGSAAELPKWQASKSCAAKILLIWHEIIFRFSERFRLHWSILSVE